MAVICPAILASDADSYHSEMEKIAGFAERIQIDLTDGQFAKSKTVKPQDAWWPVGIKADFHLMYRHPHRAFEVIMEHRPNLIIVHAESEGDFVSFTEMCRQRGVKAGVALLPKTPPEAILSAMKHIDHVLIFSGNLGEYGGRANLDLLNKVDILRHHKPDIEIGWDGGINEQNISRLAFGGVDVFNVGGYLQNADNPAHAYKTLNRIAEETGTT
jgi:ribulose-phosphate 3-epimerase